jgi:hypothetical protein
VFMARGESAKLKEKYPLLDVTPRESALLADALALIRTAPAETRTFFEKFLMRWPKLG